MTKKIDVEALAALARIRLAPEEKQKLSEDLEKILGYVEELSALNIEGVPPTTHVLSMTNVFREDEVRPAKVRDKLLDHAPNREGNFFKVPKVIDRES